GRAKPGRAEPEESALCERRHGEMCLLPRFDVLSFKRPEEERLVTNDRKTQRGPALIALILIFALRRVRQRDLLTVNADGLHLRIDRLAVRETFNGQCGQLGTRSVLRRIVEEVAGVERRMIEEIIKLAVKEIGPRFRHGVDLRTDAAAEF